MLRSWPARGEPLMSGGCYCVGMGALGRPSVGSLDLVKAEPRWGLCAGGLGLLVSVGRLPVKQVIRGVC